MADDITKKILIDIQLKGQQIKQEIPQITTQIDALVAAQKKLTDEGKKSSAEFVDNASKLRILKTELRDSNRAVDNVAKAVDAQSNSIKQNRALLSIMTGDVIKLSDAELNKAAPAVAALTVKLKDQEKQIGQTYRNVGNYEEAFTKALSTIGGAIPGFQKFNTAITTVVKGFGFLPGAINNSQTATAKLNQTLGFMPQTISNTAKETENLAVQTGEAAVKTENLAEAAPAAGSALGGISGVAVGLIAAIALIVVGIASIISWFAKLTPNAEKLQRGFAGLGGAYTAFMSDLGQGVGFGQLFDDMAKAYKQAKELTGAMQDLARESEIVAVANAQADTKIADLQLKMRNRRNTPEQEQAYFNQIQNISNQSYKQRKDIADKEYDLAVRAATIGRKFTDDEINQLRTKGIAYAAYLDKLKGLANKGGAGTDIQNIAKAQEDQAAAERYQETIQDRAQNRLDAAQMKADAAAQKELEMLDKIKQKTLEANSERIASITRMLEFQQEAFGRELSTTDEHYRQLIFKQQKFIAQQQTIANNPRNSSRVRGAANGAINAGRADISQLQKEQYIATEKLLVDHNKAMIDETAKAALDLRSIQIASIKDIEERELASLDNQNATRQLQLQNENATIQDNINKLNSELKNTKGKYSADEIQALKQTLDTEYTLLSNNSDKSIELTKQTEEQKKQIRQKAAQDSLISQDQAGVIKTGQFGSSPDKTANIAAQQKELDDNHNYNLQRLADHQITSDEFLVIDEKYIADSNALKYQAAKDLKDFELSLAKDTADAALSIIGNSNKANTQRAEVELSKSKDKELANTSLTSAQKLAINNKYRILEGKEKVKEFLADQKLQIAKAVIDGALAIVAAEEQPYVAPFVIPGIIATTAISIAKIASQKPPAYATGGVHVSDGKGGALPGYSRKDNVNAQLRSGEGIVVSEAMKDPHARNIVSGINVAFGGRDFSVPNPGRGYAIGGIVTDGGDSNRYYAQPMVNTDNLANTIAYQLVNNFPPVYVDVKDINNQQSIKAKTVNRVNL